MLHYYGGMRGPTTKHLALGNALHVALEKGHKGVWDFEYTISTFQDEFTRILKDDEVFIPYPEIRKYEAMGIEMISIYNRELVKGNILLPTEVEKEFKLPLAEGVVAVGKIDKIITPSPTGGIIVVDYKSGQKEPTPWFLRHNLQFTCYAWAAQILYGEYPKS